MEKARGMLHSDIYQQFTFYGQNLKYQRDHETVRKLQKDWKTTLRNWAYAEATKEPQKDFK